MAKSNAERQAAYQRRRKELNQTGELSECRQRISTDLTLSVKFSLMRLTSYYRLNQRQMLEQLILQEEKRVTADMSYERFCDYGDRKLTVSR